MVIYGIYTRVLNIESIKSHLLYIYISSSSLLVKKTKMHSQMYPTKLCIQHIFDIYT